MYVRVCVCTYTHVKREPVCLPCLSLCMYVCIYLSAGVHVCMRMQVALVVCIQVSSLCMCMQVSLCMRMQVSLAVTCTPTLKRYYASISCSLYTETLVIWDTVQVSLVVSIHVISLYASLARMRMQVFLVVVSSLYASLYACLSRMRMQVYLVLAVRKSVCKYLAYAHASLAAPVFFSVCMYIRICICICMYVCMYVMSMYVYNLSVYLYLYLSPDLYLYI